MHSDLCFDEYFCVATRSDLRIRQLLAPRLSKLKSIYRAPIDWVEQTTTGGAHAILVAIYLARSFLSAALSVCLVRLSVCLLSVCMSIANMSGISIHFAKVNSNYTRGVFAATFRRLSVTPAVLYPSLNFAAFDITLVNPFCFFQVQSSLYVQYSRSSVVSFLSGFSHHRLLFSLLLDFYAAWCTYFFLPLILSGPFGKNNFQLVSVAYISVYQSI